MASFSAAAPRNVVTHYGSRSSRPFRSEMFLWSHCICIDLSIQRSRSSAGDTKMFLYPGNEHLFTDDSLPLCDDLSTRRVSARMLEFLGEL